MLSLLTIFVGVYYQEFGVMMEDACMIESKNNSTLADMEKMTNKVLLWCGRYQELMHSEGINSVFLMFTFHTGVTVDWYLQLMKMLHVLCRAGTRTSNLLACMHTGMPPAIFAAPAPGYMVRWIILQTSQRMRSS